MEVPFGGSYGAVRVDPKQISPREVERITRRYTSEVSIFIGPEKDISHPDVSTNDQTMAWMLDTYSMNRGHTTLGVVTGKPQILGGTVGREQATARGVCVTIREACAARKIPLQNARVAVQGYGSSGSETAIILEEMGCKVIAVSDSRGGIFNKDGLDTKAVKQVKAEAGSVTWYKKGDTLTNEELLALECDILVPAAIENVITSKNANDLKCKILCEAANGPCSLPADMIINDKGIFLIPDILANAGSVVSSYFEWVQGLVSFFGRSAISTRN